MFVVEVWHSTPGEPTFRASVRPVECTERQWFDDVQALARFFGACTPHEQLRPGDDDLAES